MALRHLPPRPVHLLASTPSQGQSSVMAARRIGLGSWSTFPLTALPGPGSGLSTVDCPVVRFCQATGNWGGGLIAERFDGTTGGSRGSDKRAHGPVPG